MSLVPIGRKSVSGVPQHAPHSPQEPRWQAAVERSDRHVGVLTYILDQLTLYRASGWCFSLPPTSAESGFNRPLAFTTGLA
jgi:hypothetical protein